jgi:hypothetical protein
LELLQGVLPNNTLVAVKQLLMPSKVATPKQVFILDEFLNEMVLISGMRHRNLIKLRGCCEQRNERFLVYDFANNHDLDWVLLGQTLTQNFFMLNSSRSILHAQFFTFTYMFVLLLLCSRSLLCLSMDDCPHPSVFLFIPIVDF